MNRQTWLLEAVDILKHDWGQVGETVPEKISVFPTWQKCYPRTYRGVYIQYRLSGKIKIYIDPRIDAGLEVLDVLSHELVHCVAGGQGRHGREFHRVATVIGLTKGSTLNATAGEALLKRLREIQEMLGEYPTCKCIKEE